AVCCSLLPELLPRPSPEKLAEMASYFEHRWGPPRCVGAIDGSHIPIIAPQEYRTDYYNQKGWYSIVLQAVVDGRGLFWDISVGKSGSVHDATVLRASLLWSMITSENLFPPVTRSLGGEDVGYFLVGDGAYPSQPWLVKPYADNGRLCHEQLVFNEKISRARVCVENAFGRLKGRWRCLMKRNDCSVETVKKMALTCCVLRNLCKLHNEEFQPAWVGAQLEEEMEQPAAALPERRGPAPAERVREGLLRHLNNDGQIIVQII
uniref:DDE Tnp4 domain-containing protein n=1 Tax=Myripristis murdjan TaxID=586833 RepID=A0A668AYU4_9TELE